MRPGDPRGSLRPHPPAAATTGHGACRAGGVTEEERSGDCDIHHAAVRPGRRQHAGAAREDPAARDRRRDRGRRRRSRSSPTRSGSGSRCWSWSPLAIFFVYLQPWHIPLKYLVPGTIFLVAFQVVPVVSTVRRRRSRTSVTATAGTKDDAITAIEGSSVKQVPGSAEYVLTIATEGDVATGNLVVPALRPGHQGGPVGDDDGPAPPCTDCVTTADAARSRPPAT